MKIIVNPHFIKIESEELINENQSNISDCTFEFDKNIADDFVKEAYFSKNSEVYKVIIQNNKCNYPSEILKTKGIVEIGVVAYKIINDELIRYSPSPANFYIEDGSYKEDAKNSKPITPSELEQYEQALNNGLNEVREELKLVEQIGQVAEKNSSEAKKQGDYAKEQGTKTEEIANTVKEKLNNGDFIGPEGKQGIQGPPGPQGKPGEKPDMSNYYNKNEIDNKIGSIDEVLNEINGEVIK